MCKGFVCAVLCYVSGCLVKSVRSKGVYVSVEHLLLAFHSDKRFGQQLFKNLQLSEKALKDAVQAVRGSQRVTDQRTNLYFKVSFFFPLEI